MPAASCPTWVVLLVTAHPDDECMFFTPTIQHLHGCGATIWLLCLSTGDADGLGKIRKKELLCACDKLKIVRERIVIVDDVQLRDGMGESWEAQIVANHVEAVAAEVQPALIVTFDGYGVSGHPNHRAVYQGVLQFIYKYRGSSQFIDLQVLESVSLMRKYSALLDVVFSLLSSAVSGGTVCRVSTSPWVTWQAMTEHQSQLVWYRKLFVVLSRYTYVNTLRSI